MDKNQIEEFKKALQANRDSLRSTLETFAKEDTKPEGDWDTKFPKFKGGMEEKADEVEEYSSLLPVEHALEVKLKNINDALNKIDNGEYGKCEKCGNEISYQRLKIIPETKTCKDCK